MVWQIGGAKWFSGILHFRALQMPVLHQPARPQGRLASTADRQLSGEIGEEIGRIVSYIICIGF